MHMKNISSKLRSAKSKLMPILKGILSTFDGGKTADCIP